MKLIIEFNEKGEYKIIHIDNLIDTGIQEKRKGNYWNALKVYLEASELDKLNLETHNELGKIQFILGEYERAVLSFYRAAVISLKDININADADDIKRKSSGILANIGMHAGFSVYAQNARDKDKYGIQEREMHLLNTCLSVYRSEIDSYFKIDDVPYTEEIIENVRLLAVQDGIMVLNSISQDSNSEIEYIT